MQNSFKNLLLFSKTVVMVTAGSGKIRYAAGAIGTKHSLEAKKPAAAVLAAAFAVTPR